VAKKVTTVRMPEELAEEIEVLARGRGVSVNTVVLDALAAEIERIKKDPDFIARLQEITTKDKEILDRLAR
jgi:predicted transcriptional regulator